MALSGKQMRFVEEYLIDLNATQAAIRAGYSEKTAHSQGPRLLEHVEIQALLAEAQAKRSQRTEITQDRVLAELAKIGFSDLREALTSQGGIISPQDWSDEFAPAVASMEIVKRQSGEYDGDGNPIMESVHKIRSWDKLSALEKMGKHLGMFGGDSAPVTINMPFTGFTVERASKPDTPDTD